MTVWRFTSLPTHSTTLSSKETVIVVAIDSRLHLTRFRCIRLHNLPGGVWLRDRTWPWSNCILGQMEPWREWRSLVQCVTKRASRLETMEGHSWQICLSRRVKATLRTETSPDLHRLEQSHMFPTTHSFPLTFKQLCDTWLYGLAWSLTFDPALFEPTTRARTIHFHAVPSEWCSALRLS